MNHFFVFEGLDGVGKTTLLENLQKDGYEVFVNPTEIHKGIRTKLHNKGKASLFYYLSSNAYIIEEQAKNKNNFLIDRYITSSFIADLYNDGKYKYNDFEKLFKTFSPFFKLPKITFFLTLDEDLRLKRIKDRNDSNNYDQLDKNYSLLWDDVIQNYNFSKKVIIDANKSELELVEEIKFYIQKG